jgi:hypothetical protein
MFQVWEDALRIYQKEDPFNCPNILKNINKLRIMFALWELYQDSVSLYESGFFAVGTAPILLEAIKILLKELRP